MTQNTTPPQSQPDDGVPVIGLLGPLRLLHRPPAPARGNQLLAVATFIAHQPGATRIDICEQVFGVPITRNTFNPRISNLRRWLGTHPITGKPLLPRTTEREGYRLHPDVVTDLQLLQNLTAVSNAPTDTLQTALGLVRGRPFSGAVPRYYSWSADLQSQARQDVLRLCATLAERHWREGRHDLAEQTAVRGLSIEPADETLCRWQYRALHQVGAVHALGAAVRELAHVNAELQTPCEPATLRLLNSLAARS